MIMSPNNNKNAKTLISDPILVVTNYDYMCKELNQIPKLYAI